LQIKESDLGHASTNCTSFSYLNAQVKINRGAKIKIKVVYK